MALMKLRTIALLWLALLVGVSLLGGCSRVGTGGLIAKGEVVFVQLGDKPVLRGAEIGSWSAETFVAGKIEVYPSCIIVTEPNGTKHMAPPERFGAVRFK